MSALKDLLPGSPLGDDQKVYDYILEGIKTKNCGVEIVTSAFVEDLTWRKVDMNQPQILVCPVNNSTFLGILFVRWKLRMCPKIFNMHF